MMTYKQNLSYHSKVFCHEELISLVAIEKYNGTEASTIKK